MDTTLEIVRFCAGECFRQKTTPLAVPNMVEAFMVAKEWENANTLTTHRVTRLGAYVSPLLEFGFRHTSVTFRDGTVVGWENIQRQIMNLVAHVPELSAYEFYQEFEEIHPFEDGNGRVGAILFNLCAGTMDHPEVPPEFKKKGV